MIHQFSLKIDPIHGTGEILLNKQPVFPQSQLQICTTQHFLEWYSLLPDLMFAEVNDSYSVSAECPDICSELLRTVFSSAAECLSFTHTPCKSAYSAEKRLTWLKEAAAQTKTQLPELPKFSIHFLYDSGPEESTLLGSLSPFYRNLHTTDRSDVNIWVVGHNTPSIAFSQPLTENDLILCCDTNPHPPADSKKPVLFWKQSMYRDAVEAWIDQIILFPYLLYCQEILRSKPNNTAFSVESRIQMLSRNEPYIHLKLPSRIESGTSCPIELHEFPQSNLSLRITDPKLVTQTSNMLLAGRPGRTKIAVISETGNVLQENDIEVYFVNRVTSISLSSASGNTFLPGEHFTISANYHPKNAENLSQAVWSISPANALRNIGGGQFAALSAGKCTVTLTIGKVSQSFSLTVVPLASDIRLPKEIRIKENAAPLRISASLLPAGSACKTIQCSVADRSIARWDPTTRSVLPVGEGNTWLTVQAVDSGGNVLFRKQCPITILPAKDVITPPTLLTLAVCCTVLALFTAATSFFPYSMMGCIAFFLISTIVNLIPWINQRATKSNILQASISAAGFLLAVLIMFIVYG